jgi:NAD(P)-dependent dehydrogenase (short-subunit alcohol dehydrogenase family)
MRGLEGKVAMVAGGATSLGAAIARAFHRAGTRVAIADIDAAAGEALAAGLAGVFCRTDVTDDAQIRGAIEAALGAFGGVDFFVNTACTFADSGLASTRQEWLQALNVNIVSGAVFVRELAPHMKRRGGGAIVQFGSIAGKFGQRGRMLYPVAKAAMQQVTRSLAMELAPDKIRVNTISPGWTWSRVIEGLAKGDRAKADRIGGEYHPLGRIGDAEDVASAALFLCSDEARHITGVDLPVDGGYAITGPDRGIPAMGRLGE